MPKHRGIWDVFHGLSTLPPCFWAYLGQNLAGICKIQFFGLKGPQKWAKMGLTQKSKKQVLFVFQKASLSQKIRKFGKFGIEFYYLEGNFGPIFLTMGFPVHFTYFRRTSQL